eukprot:219658_1
MSQDTPINLVEIFTGKLPDVDHINTVGFPITRLQVISPTRAFVAVYHNLYEINIRYPSATKLERGRQGPFISRPMELENIQMNLILTMKHPIQQINIIPSNDDNLMISCIDDHGVIAVKLVKEIGAAPPLKKRKLNTNTPSDDSSISYEVQMQHDNVWNRSVLNGLHMSGYCGLDRNPQNKDEFACISSYYRMLSIGCRDKMIRTLSLCQTPTTVKYYSIPKSGNDSSVILVNEGNILSVWDPRELTKCVQRIDLRHKMYSMDFNTKSSSRYIGCCGEDKIVYVVDPMKWNVHSMWKSCSKYELLQCKFSGIDDGKYVYCVGMDNDLICGEWETKQHNKKNKKKNKNTQSTNDVRYQHCFRVDSKWMGVDYVSHRHFESMIGITDTATVYVAHKPHLLNASAHT